MSFPCSPSPSRRHCGLHCTRRETAHGLTMASLPRTRPAGLAASALAASGCAGRGTISDEAKDSPDSGRSLDNGSARGGGRLQLGSCTTRMLGWLCSRRRRRLQARHTLGSCSVWPSPSRCHCGRHGRQHKTTHGLAISTGPRTRPAGLAASSSAPSGWACVAAATTPGAI